MGVVSRTALVAFSAALFVGCAPAQTVVPAAEPPGSSPVAGAAVPFAPYVDVTSKHPSLASVVADTLARRFVLAFALAKDSQCEPAWGGNLPVNDAALLADIAAVLGAGGAVSVATGGAVGTYLENSCDTAAALVEAYRTALSATGADRLEVDVEAEIPVDLVADALTSVRRELGVEVTITAVVADSVRGLTPSTVSLLRAGDNWRDPDRRRGNGYRSGLTGVARWRPARCLPPDRSHPDGRPKRHRGRHHGAGRERRSGLCARSSDRAQRFLVIGEGQRGLPRAACRERPMQRHSQDPYAFTRALSRTGPGSRHPVKPRPGRVQRVFNCLEAGDVSY
jgi:hypothetical protein